jgi:hypothetical protein
MLVGTTYRCRGCRSPRIVVQVTGLGMMRLVESASVLTLLFVFLFMPRLTVQSTVYHSIEAQYGMRRSEEGDFVSKTRVYR